MLIEFMTILVLAKIGLCGLTFFLFLKYHFHLIGKDIKNYHAVENTSAGIT